MAIAKLRSEVSQLESLYFGSRYASDVAAQNLREAKLHGTMDLAQPIDSVGHVDDYSVPTGYAVHRYLRRRHLSHMREVILVRLISALEVFLVDSVYGLFMSRKDLFVRGGKIEINYGELLSAHSISDIWSTMIERECRRLQNRGFTETKKFYLQQLGIDFNSSGVPMSTLEELHERRHLLVHRLGKTDAYYRHRYATGSSALKVSEEYLLEAFQAVQKLGAYIDGESSRLVRVARPSGFDPRAHRVRMTLIDLDSEALPLLDDDFQFAADDESYRLADILESKLGSQSAMTVILAGPAKVVRAYTKVLRRMAREGLLQLQERAVLSQGHQCALTDEEVAMIAERLPPRPWPRHIHKDIAEELGYSNKQVSAAISLILDAPD